MTSCAVIVSQPDAVIYGLAGLAFIVTIQFIIQAVRR
jgi:hypothetical protein